MRRRLINWLAVLSRCSVAEGWLAAAEESAEGIGVVLVDTSLYLYSVVLG